MQNRPYLAEQFALITRKARSWTPDQSLQEELISQSFPSSNKCRERKLVSSLTLIRSFPLTFPRHPPMTLYKKSKKVPLREQVTRQLQQPQTKRFRMSSKYPLLCFMGWQSAIQLSFLGARVAGASDVQGFTVGEAPSITLQKPSPKETAKEPTAVIETTATPGVARMTFSSGTKTQSGFTPDKDHDARTEASQQEVWNRLACYIVVSCDVKRCNKKHWLSWHDESRKSLGLTGGLGQTRLERRRVSWR